MLKIKEIKNPSQPKYFTHVPNLYSTNSNKKYFEKISGLTVAQYKMTTVTQLVFRSF